MGKILEPTDLSDIMKPEVIVEEIVGLARPMYVLRALCKVFQLDELEAKVPTATKFTGQKKVKPMEKVKLDSSTWGEIPVDCYKNCVNFALAFETTQKSRWDLIRIQADESAKTIARMEDEDIRDVLVTLVAIAGSDWKTSSNDPMVDIMAAITAIIDNGYDADKIAMSGSAYAAMVSNPNIKNTFERGALVSGKIPSIAGLQVLYSSTITAKEAYVVDSMHCILLADGPAAKEDYHGEGSFMQGFAVAKFLDVVKINDDAGRRITGILP